MKESNVVVSMGTTEKLLYDRKSAAFALSVSVRTLDYYLAQRAFDTRKIGRKVLITAASLRAFAARNHYGPVDQQANMLEAA